MQRRKHRIRPLLATGTGLDTVVLGRLTIRPPVIRRVQRHHTALEWRVIQQTGERDIEDKTVIDLEVLLGTFSFHALAYAGGRNNKPKRWFIHDRTHNVWRSDGGVLSGNVCGQGWPQSSAHGCACSVSRKGHPRRF